MKPTTTNPPRLLHPLLKMDLGQMEFDCLPSIHAQTRVEYIGTIGSILAALAAAASISTTAYSALQPGPKSPNLASSSRQVAQAQANALPGQRALSAAEQQGGQATVHVAANRAPTQMVRIQQGQNSKFDAGESWAGTAAAGADPIGGGILGMEGIFGNSQPNYKYVVYNKADWEPGGKYYDPTSKFDVNKNIVTRDHLTKAHDQTYDFKGYGTADIQGDLARQMADMQGKLEAKYGVAFAQQARKEAEQADPQGFAARAKEQELIQKGIDRPMPISPLATELDSRMKSRIDAGPNLDQMSRDLLDKAIARSNADRGGSSSADDVARQLGTGMEGAARRQAGIGQGQAWLSSGATPEDVQYRREQQNLSNLGSFVAGQTPQSQFANLSGASNGAAPFYPGGSGPSMPNNAGPAGQGFGIAQYLAQLRTQQNSASPWMSGLSSLLSGVGSFANTGGQPTAHP